MFGKTITLFLVVCCFISINSLAYDRSSRNFALNAFNVKRNIDTLLRTNRCVNCYLAYAKLSGIDLTDADLRGSNLIGTTFIRATLLRANLAGAKLAGANFSGAQWIDGSICRVGSIGQCNRDLPQ